MINRINPNLLNDTLNLVQLAQETARQRGSQKQVEKLDPVVNQLRTIVNSERDTKPVPNAGIMAQDDFKTLLTVTQVRKMPPAGTTNFAERNQLVNALSAGGMADTDIARNLGVTRDEVRMVLNLADLSKKVGR